MTTRPSSSLAAKTAPSIALVDAQGRLFPTGKQLGRGGEGSVYDVEGEPSLVAKVYHKAPLEEDQVAKLEAMVRVWSEPLETIAAWPRAILLDPANRQPCGILMTKMAGARPLHELYGTTNRRRHFPEVGWHHLVLAARNTAAAFHTLHAAGIVVGDVNQGNMLVDKNMCVRLIDCDSFQITSGDRTFACPVGTPHFTPPELQSQKLRDVMRTGTHDRFGLAVLVFHLLFVGRHPFAGRYRGAGDLSIEKAIGERRFAFSKDRAATLVDPPPASLLPDDLPPGLAGMFEAAFRTGGVDGTPRPSPLDWIRELESLMKRRTNCTYDPMHVYFADLDECPWCRIEDGGGPSFFVPSGSGTIVTVDRLKALDLKIRQLKELEFPALPPEQLAMPRMPSLKVLKTAGQWTRVETAAALLAACWGACAAGVIYGAALIGGAAASLLPAGYLLFGKEPQARRKTVEDYRARLRKIEQRLFKTAQMIASQHRRREYAFSQSTEDLKNEIAAYRAEGEQLRKVLLDHRDVQKTGFLRGFLIRDFGRSIPGMTSSKVTMLESFGVETAADVERIKLLGIPSIDEDMTMELMNWRGQMERGFVFNPEHGVTIKDLNTGADSAARKFKMSQARKILTASKQREGLVATGRMELARALRQYDKLIGEWKDVAKELRDFQSGRRRFELAINGSKVTIAALAAGVPTAAMLLHWVFG